MIHNVLITFLLMLGFVGYLIVPSFIVDFFKDHNLRNAGVALAGWYAFWPLFLIVSVVR